MIEMDDLQKVSRFTVCERVSALVMLCLLPACAPKQLPHDTSNAPGLGNVRSTFVDSKSPVVIGGDEAGSSGLIREAASAVVVDPESGEILEPSQLPRSLVPAAALQATDPMSSSSGGLVERPVASKAGGVMVDLQGRFRSRVSAVVSPEGDVSIERESGDAQAKPDER